MAKLVIGSSKQNGVPAIVKEVTIQPDLGTKTITINGTYNASTDNLDGYSTVTVNVPTVVEPYLELENRTGYLYGSRTTSHVIDLTGVTQIYSGLSYSYYQNTVITTAPDFSQVRGFGPYVCYSMFSRAQNLTGRIVMGPTSLGESACRHMFAETKITEIVFNQTCAVSSSLALSAMCKDCLYLQSADLSGLTKLTGTQVCDGMFSGCTALTTANLSNVDEIGTSSCMGMFSGDTSLASVLLGALASIDIQGGVRMFEGCTALTSFTFVALSSVARNACKEMFKNSGIQFLSFPALKTTSFGSRTDQFNNMLSGVTGCTVHFPSNLQSVIGSWADVTAGFGGTNTTILYDLPATE